MNTRSASAFSAQVKIACAVAAWADAHCARTLSAAGTRHGQADDRATKGGIHRGAAKFEGPATDPWPDCSTHPSDRTQGMESRLRTGRKRKRQGRIRRRAGRGGVGSMPEGGAPSCGAWARPGTGIARSAARQAAARTARARVRHVSPNVRALSGRLCPRAGPTGWEIGERDAAARAGRGGWPGRL